MSNIQGTSAVGSMVVFVNGRPEPREYRRFRIRSGETPDDFRMMAEVLRRRFSPRRAAASRNRGAVAGRGRGRRGARGRLGDEAARPAPRIRPIEGALLAAARDAGWALPDLVIVDGGKGQLSAAVGVMRELDLADVPVAGLAKRFEELYLPGRSDPIVLPRKQPGALPRPAHPRRGASVCHHLSPRRSAAAARWRSVFDEVEGIGPARKKALLKRFGSVRRIREASVDELAETPGIPRELAERLKRHLAREGMLA